MTSTPGLDPIRAITAAPIPYNFYREVHKGLRHALFQLTTATGAADATDSSARDAVAEHVHRVIGMLNAHHNHEDTFIQPLIEERAPTLAPLVSEGHTESEADLVEIEMRTDKLTRTTGNDAVVAACELYGCLALFTARYLAHMGLEEGAVMTALRESTTVEDLFALDMAIRTSIAPPTMCEFLNVTMPAVNIDERTDILAGMRAGAPHEIFELFRAATQASLHADQYTAVAARLGLT